MELNPNHPVTSRAHDQWHKICLLLMRKMGIREMEITPSDIDSLSRANRAIVIRDDGKKITVCDMDLAEAEKLGRKEGGLPV